MRIKYDATDPKSVEFDVPREAVEGLKAFGESMCRAKRKAEPEYAHCWNVFQFEIDDQFQPSFMFGGEPEDLPTPNSGGCVSPVYVVDE